MNETDPIAHAAYYRMTAVIYIENAKYLEGAFRARGERVAHNRMAYPYYVLVQHAFELLLKTALLKRGVSARELKSAHVRHDLVVLLNSMTAKGVPISPSARELLSVLSTQHSKHTLRYDVLFDGGDPVYTPEPEYVYEVFEELLLAGRMSTFGA